MMNASSSLLLFTLLVARTSASANVFVNLWHTYVTQEGVTVFWDSKVAPILEQGPEFLHEDRETSPSGVAYSIDMDEDSVILSANDVTEALTATMPDGQADRYYLFVDRTDAITSFEVTSDLPEGVTVAIIPKGTLLEFEDRSFPVTLSAELEQDTILVEVGPNARLDDPNFSLALQYNRVESIVPMDEAVNPFHSGASISSLAAASLLAGLASCLLLL